MIDTRELCRKLSLQRSRIQQRIAELEVEADRLQDVSSRDGSEPHPLRKLGAILNEYGDLCTRANAIELRYEMLIAYDYQRRHGFPLLEEMAQRNRPGEIAIPSPAGNNQSS